MNTLVLGGSGYFGTVLVRELLLRSFDVRVLDLIDIPDRPPEVEFVHGSILDSDLVRETLDGIDIVFNTVAQVPISKNRKNLTEVNVVGTQRVLSECRKADISKFVHLSSSAVFGRPQSNPVSTQTIPAPREHYGRTKYEGELLCQYEVSQGRDISIIRPRTVLGPGRMGIFSLLFDWIADGVDVFVLGAGDNVYQFVHATDLADACIRASQIDGPGIFNIGTDRFGTMRQSLEALTKHAQTGSKVKELPRRPTEAAMSLLSALHLAPIAPYHTLMYGDSFWFDIEDSKTTLRWQPKFSNEQMLIESYESYIASRDEPKYGSGHSVPLNQGVLRLIKHFL